MVANPDRRSLAEWLSVLCGIVTICVVLAFCFWRIQAGNDYLARQEQMLREILHNQVLILNSQREAAEILRKYR